MARILRSTLPDGYFHVYTRGVADTAIFRDDEDRRSFLALLIRAARRNGWELHALCLMTTHYHVVLESTQTHLSVGMQWLNGIYAQGFNRRHAREGHLFGSRYGSRALDSEEYVERVCDYVVDNPVRAGLCERPSHWPWSATRYDLPE